MIEIWRHIKNYEGYYLVSNCGNIKSLKRKRLNGGCLRERILKPGIRGRGYLFVNLCRNRHKGRINIHRAVAKAFIFNPKYKPCINHKDGNKLNNSVTNLEWCTYTENEFHKNSILGLNNKGVNHGKSILTETDIIQIRNSGIPQEKLSKIFGVSQAHISNIQNKRTWTHI